MNAPTKTKNPTARDEDTALLLQGEISDALRIELGLKPEFANQFGMLVANYLRRRLGTQNVYIPAPSRAERDAAILREYTGSNAGEVCQRHGVSRPSLHRICQEQRQLQRAQRLVSCLETRSTLD